MSNYSHLLQRNASTNYHIDLLADKVHWIKHKTLQCYISHIPIRKRALVLSDYSDQVPDTHLHWQGYLLLKSSVVGYYPILWPLDLCNHCNYLYPESPVANNRSIFSSSSKKTQHSRNQVIKSKLVQESSFKFKSHVSSSTVKIQVQESSFKFKSEKRPNSPPIASQL